MKKIVSVLTLTSIVVTMMLTCVINVSAGIGDPVINYGDVIYSCDFTTMPEGQLVRSVGNDIWKVENGVLVRDGTDAQKNCAYYFNDSEKYVSGESYIISVKIKINEGMENNKAVGICTVTQETIDTSTMAGNTYTVWEPRSEGTKGRVNNIQGTKDNKWSNLSMKELDRSPYEWVKLSVLVQGYQVDVFLDDVYINSYFRESTHSCIAIYGENKASFQMDDLTVYSVKEEAPTETETEPPKATETDAPKPTETNAPDTKPTVDNASDTTNENTDGCGATVSFGIVAVATLGVCAVTVRRKRTR